MMRLLLSYVVLIIGLLLSYRGYSQGESENLDSFPYVEYGFYLDEKPRFEKGKEGLVDWFNATIDYPPVLSEHNLQVSFYFKVIADTNGRISIINTFCGKARNRTTKEYYSSLQDSVARTLNMEIARLIGIMPVFIPGRYAGRKRAISFTFTLKFNPDTARKNFIIANDPFILPIYPSQSQGQRQ